MKTIILFLAIISASFSQVNAQSPCAQFENNGLESTEAYFEDFKNFLQINLDRLHQTGVWAKKTKKKQVYRATDRLNTWAEEFIKFIEENKDKNMEAVCEKFEKEREYIGDFVQLSIYFYFTNGMNWDKVDYSKYK